MDGRPYLAVPDPEAEPEAVLDADLDDVDVEHLDGDEELDQVLLGRGVAGSLKIKSDLGFIKTIKHPWYK